MGFEENHGFGKTSGKADRSIFDKWEIEQAERAAAEKRKLEDAMADAQAIWALADSYVPPDIQEFGRRHGIPELTAEVFRAGFIAGWRAHDRAQREGSVL